MYISVCIYVCVYIYVYVCVDTVDMYTYTGSFVLKLCNLTILNGVFSGRAPCRLVSCSMPSSRSMIDRHLCRIGNVCLGLFVDNFESTLYWNLRIDKCIYMYVFS